MLGFEAVKRGSNDKKCTADYVVLLGVFLVHCCGYILETHSLFVFLKS